MSEQPIEIGECVPAATIRAIRAAQIAACPGCVELRAQLEQWREIGRQRAKRTIVEYRMPGDQVGRIGCYSCGGWGYKDTGLVHRVSCDVGQMQALLEKGEK